MYMLKNLHGCEMEAVEGLLNERTGVRRRGHEGWLETGEMKGEIGKGLYMGEIATEGV